VAVEKGNLRGPQAQASVGPNRVQGDVLRKVRESECGGERDWVMFEESGGPGKVTNVLSLYLRRHVSLSGGVGTKAGSAFIEKNQGCGNPVC